jgi:integral membrane protein (TIGR01906 family)
MRSHSTAIFLAISWLITILVPVALSLGAVRIILLPWYLQFEYHTPNFPVDPFGFTLADRLRYSRLALNYLLNDAGPEYLADLHFPTGQQAPPESCQFMKDCTLLYNEREIQHMVDVKRTVQAALKILYATLAILVVSGIWAWQAHWMEDYRIGLARGGWLTIFLIGIIILLVIASFSVIFVFFHEIFFQAGTWTFLFSDTLIRLFPERFWRDTFLLVGFITAALAGLVIFLTPRIGR